MSDDLTSNNLLWSITQRVMKSAMIAHAINSGAAEDWVESLELLDAFTVYNVVSIVYGEPKAFQLLN